MRRSLSVVLGLVTASALTIGGVAGAPGAGAATAESALVSRANAARTAAGLPALSVHSDLADVARRHSGAMAGRSTLSHSGLSGVCCFTSLAENVGLGASVDVVHATFMRSGGHRANILNPAMRHIGIGIVRSGGTLWVTEIFRAPAGNSSTTTKPKPPRASPDARNTAVARSSRAVSRRSMVLRTRIRTLSGRPAGDAADPIAAALRWSGTMRALTAPPQ